jgi:hypothetical protein
LFVFTLVVSDAYSNVVPTFVGTVRFRTDDVSALIALRAFTFTAADRGRRSFRSAFYTLGAHWLQAVDGADHLSSNVATVTVWT